MFYFKSLKNIYLSLMFLLISSTAVLSDEFMILNSDNIPKDYPIRLVENHNTSIGDLADFEVRPLSFTIQNITDKTVDIICILSGCSCIVLDKKINNISLSPQERYTFTAKIYGSKLASGNFSRVVFIEPKNAKVAKLFFTGKRIDAIKFSPGKSIDLGSFAGDVYWERSIKLTSTFPPNKLKLKAPKDNVLFHYKFTQLSPIDFRLDFSPKHLPMKKGFYSFSFDLEASGIPNYGPVEYAVHFKVLPRRFHLQKNRHVINLATIDKDKPYTLVTSIHSGPKPRRERSFFQTSHQHKTRKSPTYLPVSVEENKAYPLDSIETWEKFSKSVRISKNFGSKTISYRIVPQNDRIDIITEFPPNFFKESSAGRYIATVLFDNRNIDHMAIFWH